MNPVQPIPFGNVTFNDETNTPQTLGVSLTLLDQHGQPMNPPPGYSLSDGAFQRLVQNCNGLAGNILTAKSQACQAHIQGVKAGNGNWSWTQMDANNLLATQTPQGGQPQAQPITHQIGNPQFNTTAPWQNLEQQIIRYFTGPQPALAPFNRGMGPAPHLGFPPSTMGSSGPHHQYAHPSTGGSHPTWARPDQLRDAHPLNPTDRQGDHVTYHLGSRGRQHPVRTTSMTGSFHQPAHDQHLVYAAPKMPSPRWSPSPTFSDTQAMHDHETATSHRRQRRAYSPSRYQTTPSPTLQHTTHLHEEEDTFGAKPPRVTRKTHTGGGNVRTSHRPFQAPTSDEWDHLTSSKTARLPAHQQMHDWEGEDELPPAFPHTHPAVAKYDIDAPTYYTNPLMHKEDHELPSGVTRQMVNEHCNPRWTHWHQQEARRQQRERDQQLHDALGFDESPTSTRSNSRASFEGLQYQSLPDSRSSSSLSHHERQAYISLVRLSDQTFAPPKTENPWVELNDSRFRVPSDKVAPTLTQQPLEETLPSHPTVRQSSAPTRQGLEADKTRRVSHVQLNFGAPRPGSSSLHRHSPTSPFQPPPVTSSSHQHVAPLSSTTQRLTTSSPPLSAAPTVSQPAKLTHREQLLAEQTRLEQEARLDALSSTTQQAQKDLPASELRRQTEAAPTTSDQQRREEQEMLQAQQKQREYIALLQEEEAQRQLAATQDVKRHQPSSTLSSWLNPMSYLPGKKPTILGETQEI